jgi:hypothetical protein
VTSCDVQKSFSSKQIPLDKRRSMTPENMEKILIIYCAPHHTTAPAQGPPQASSRNTPRQSMYLRHNDLNCTHVFLRQDSIRRAFEHSYSGPYQVLSRKHKTLKILVRGKPITVSADKVKPAYIFNKDCGRTTIEPATTANPATAPSPIPPPPSATKTTRCRHHVRFSVRFTS